jgi:hypothetical protein
MISSFINKYKDKFIKSNLPVDGKDHMLEEARKQIGLKFKGE